MTRHESRELAFILLFEQLVTEETMQEIILSAEEIRDVEIKDFALNLACGTDSKIDIIDQAINKYSHKWSVQRLPKVSATILRLCIYEIMFEKDIPLSVSINEAIDITKKYGTVEDSSYVNGVLSSISKDAELIGDKK